MRYSHLSLQPRLDKFIRPGHQLEHKSSPKCTSPSSPRCPGESTAQWNEKRMGFGSWGLKSQFWGLLITWRWTISLASLDLGCLCGIWPAFLTSFTALLLELQDCFSNKTILFPSPSLCTYCCRDGDTLSQICTIGSFLFLRVQLKCHDLTGLPWPPYPILLPTLQTLPPCLLHSLSH